MHRMLQSHIQAAALNRPCPPPPSAAVSDLEVEYSEEAGTLYYFKYPVAGGWGLSGGRCL